MTCSHIFLLTGDAKKGAQKTSFAGCEMLSVSNTIPLLIQITWLNAYKECSIAPYLLCKRNFVIDQVL